MRVLLFGASGQVGGELRPLLAEDHEVVAPSRAAVDLRTSGALRVCVNDVRPDLVVVAAAMTDVDRAEREPALAEQINTTAVRTIAESCAARGAALLHLSTDFVFAGDLERPYREDDDVGPVNTYGRTKLAGERAALDACERTIVVRTSWVQSLRRPCFVTRMLERARTTHTLIAADDQIGSPTMAIDLAVALRALVRAAGASVGWGALAGVYHAAGSGQASRLELVEALLEVHPDRESLRARTVVGKPASSFVTEAPRPLRTPLDCTKLERTFGVRLPAWRDGLARMSIAAERY